VTLADAPPIETVEGASGNGREVDEFGGGGIIVWKPVPAIVTVVPPAVEPLFGVMDVIEGGPSTVSAT